MNAQDLTYVIDFDQASLPQFKRNRRCSFEALPQETVGRRITCCVFLDALEQAYPRLLGPRCKSIALGFEDLAGYEKSACLRSNVLPRKATIKASYSGCEFS